MDCGETGIITEFIIVQGNGANQEYKMEKTPVGGSRDEDEVRKSTQESNERIHKRGKTSWKAQRRMVRCSGQGAGTADGRKRIEIPGSGGWERQRPNSDDPWKKKN